MIEAVGLTSADWGAFAQRRIVFGHQSVGQNILDGVQALATRSNVQLPVVKSRTFGERAGIMHFYVGENGDPSKKLQDFAGALEQGGIKAGDIALLKFCYLDFAAEMDAKALAQTYVETYEKLRQRFPEVTFIAVTAPLTVVQTGPKAWIKRLLGREPSGFGDNARRLEFNNVIRARFQPSGHVFDLAAMENVGASGHEYKGIALEAMNPSLTYDDGHLTKAGGEVVASHLVRQIAGLPRLP